jgi:hypothetical protein
MTSSHVGTGVSLANHDQQGNEKPLSVLAHHTLPVTILEPCRSGMARPARSACFLTKRPRFSVEMPLTALEHLQL